MISGEAAGNQQAGCAYRGAFEHKSRGKDVFNEGPAFKDKSLERICLAEVPPRISHAGRMCLAELLSRIRHAERMCLVEVLSRIDHAGRMCLAEVLSRISSSGRICLAECLQ